MLFVVLLRRPGALSLLLLFYLVGFFVSLGSYSPTLWLGLAMLFAFPTAGLLGLVTERTVALCRSAGELAIPGHARSVNRFQVCTLLLVVGTPLLASADGGNALALATILCGAAAIGVLLVDRPYLLFFVVVPAVLLRGFADWLANTYLQLALLAAELYVLMRWLRLPRAAETVGAVRLAGLAGTYHEETADTMADAFGVKPDDIGLHESMLEEAIKMHGHRTGRPLTAENLGFALGFDCAFRRRPTLIWAGLGCLVALIWHFAHRSQPASLGYWLVTGLVVFALVTRASTFYDAWRHSEGEQSLLYLAPAWPPGTALKPLLARAVAWFLPGGWLVWLAVAVLSYGLGSVTLDQVVTGVAVMSAASTAIASNLLLVLSRRTLKAWHASTLLSLGLPAIGALLVALRQEGARQEIRPAVLFTARRHRAHLVPRANAADLDGDPESGSPARSRIAAWTEGAAFRFATTPAPGGHRSRR